MALTLGGAMSCGSPPAPVTPPGSAPSDVRDTPEGIARQLLALTPARARALGLHEYDGRIGDYSGSGVERRVEVLRRLDAAAHALDARGPEDTLDLAVLRQMIALDLFELTELESWRKNPTFYSELLSVDEYIVRAYAPAEQRARALVSHLRAAREQLPHLRANLRPPLPEPVVKTAIDIFEGYGVYLQREVRDFLASVPSATGEGQALALQLGAEAQAIAATLREAELPRADQSHVLGRERFEHLLLAQEALSEPIERLEALAEEDLARNKAAYEALAVSVPRTRPASTELLEEVRGVVEQARAFMLDEQLVTLPVEPVVRVEETPPFMRWNSAFLNPVGVFDSADLPAYYYVTLPDPSWPPAEQASYVMTRGEIVSTSVHEVYPGHYVQGLWQRDAPTFVQKVAFSYSFGEGWAHYVEQMMIEEGFAASQPEARLGQLSDALLRNCRFVASIGIHVRGMSVQEAQRRFMDDCKQDEANARQQALRGTFDPGYFAYTLGKLQILALREEAKQRLGSTFDLRSFHDALLAHGAPPVPLIRERVLAALGAR